MNITVGDAQTGRRKLEDPGNPRVYPHTKAFTKHYGGLVCSGLFVAVLLGQLTLAGIDFLYGEPKRNGDRRDGRR
jgi:hypothetical protein